MTPEEIESKVKALISEQLEIPADQFKGESLFVADLKADSLAVVELVLKLEEEFDLEIPDEDAEKIETVQNVIDYVKKHVS